MDNTEQKRKDLCKQLQQIAYERNITQDNVSEKTGYKQSIISRVYNGKYSPSLDVFLNIADAANVDIVLQSRD